MISQIHHVAILTADIDAAIRHYVDLLGCEAKEPATVEKPGVHWRTVLLPVGTNGGTALQLIEPHEGPGVDELARGGEGTLFEIGFRCEDIEAFHDHLEERGIDASDLREEPIEEGYLESKYGNRYFIVPRSQSRGTRVEVVQFCQS